MAERRIIRRSQAMQNKKRDNHPAIPEEDEPSMRSERSVISKPKDATVEVTVKVKKRRDKSSDQTSKYIPLQEKVFRKGSWGDLLLSHSRASLNNGDDNDNEKRQRKESSTQVRKVSLKREDYDRKGCNDDHSPLCQKIPITEDLYLETHTHFKKCTSADRDEAERKVNISQRKLLVKENEELRREVGRLRKEIEVSRVRYDHNDKMTVMKTTPVSSKTEVRRTTHHNKEIRQEITSNGLTQGTQTSTSSLVVSPTKGSKPSRRGSDTVDTVDRAVFNKTPAKLPSVTPVHIEPNHQFERIRSENEELRHQISQLLIDVNKTRVENRDYCTIMQELHQAAEDLKKHNIDLQQKYDMLVLNSHEQQAVQSQLVHVIAQSNEMKQVLEILKDKQSSPTGIEDGQLLHFRNVIKDVKSTIAREMEGLVQRPPSSGFLAEKDLSDSAFKVENSLFNDTNASEIQQIFGTEPPEARRGGFMQDDGSSSTQYLTLEGMCGFESSNHRPSPLMASKYSPRISTPNSFSDFSLNLSEAGASSVLQNPTRFAPLSKPNAENGENWKTLQDMSRSFLPIRYERSNGSTSSYSSGSTSSSPNPMMKS